MRVLVTGSVATDHLLTFPGSFADSIVPDQLEHISLSFLADELEIRRGGVAANICFGMGILGLHPILVGAVGADFTEYRSWLSRHGVDTESVHVSDIRHTARFICTTDAQANQIATFYAGAMSEAREIELGPIVERVGGVDMVVIGANDPEAMLRHTRECRFRGIPFAADPSQQLAVMDGAQIRELVEGAAVLLTNEYEAALTQQRTGWSNEEILSRVGIRVTTLGAKGSKVEQAGSPAIEVPTPAEERVADPTGVGDAFRAGFLAGISWGLSLERCAQVGSLLATYVIETVGTQEYEPGRAGFLDRLAATYGQEAADEVRPHLHLARP